MRRKQRGCNASCPLPIDAIVSRCVRKCFGLTLPSLAVCTQFIPLAHVLLAHAAIAASGDSGIIPPAFAVAPSRFRIFRARALYGALPGGCGGVNKLRSAQLARGHSRKVHQTSCQRLIGAAKEVWSVTGGNTPLQTLMGTGAGVATEDVCTLRHDGTGTGIELWHGSFGWFDFMTHDGAPIILSDTWGIQIERPTQVVVLPLAVDFARACLRLCTCLFEKNTPSKIQPC